MEEDLVGVEEGQVEAEEGLLDAVEDVVHTKTKVLQPKFVVAYYMMNKLLFYHDALTFI